MKRLQAPELNDGFLRLLKFYKEFIDFEVDYVVIHNNYLGWKHFYHTVYPDLSDSFIKSDEILRENHKIYFNDDCLLFDEDAKIEYAMKVLGNNIEYAIAMPFTDNMKHTAYLDIHSVMVLFNLYKLP